MIKLHFPIGDINVANAHSHSRKLHEVLHDPRDVSERQFHLAEEPGTNPMGDLYVDRHALSVAKDSDAGMPTAHLHLRRSIVLVHLEGPCTASSRIETRGGEGKGQLYCGAAMPMRRVGGCAGAESAIAFKHRKRLSAIHVVRRLGCPLAHNIQCCVQCASLTGCLEGEAGAVVLHLHLKRTIAPGDRQLRWTRCVQAIQAHHFGNG